MADMRVRIKHKRDTSANWESRNPVLLRGELILVDTNSGELRAKVGDGVKTYTQLPFNDEVLRNLIATHTHNEFETFQQSIDDLSSAVAQKTAVQFITWEADD